VKVKGGFCLERKIMGTVFEGVRIIEVLKMKKGPRGLGDLEKHMQKG